MDPDRFEQLVFELAHAHDGKVRRLTHPDGGADTYRPPDGPRTAEVWQAKRYTTQINWKECRNSLCDSIERFDPALVTFAFARDFSERTEARFQQDLVAAGRERGVAVEVWTLSELVRRLAQNEHLRVRFFGSDLEEPLAAVKRALDAGGELGTGLDLVERAKTLAEFTGRADPDFVYSTSTSEVEAPAGLDPTSVVTRGRVIS